MKKKENKSLKKARDIALSSLMAAGCFLIMYFCGLTEVLDLCAVIVSAMIIIIAVIEIGGIYPWLIWLVSGTLCLIFIPDKFIALEFVMFGGVYPMIKAFLEQFPPVISWALKLTFFNVMLAGAFYLATKLFGMLNVGFKLELPSFILATVFFVIADVAFTMMISIYITKIRKRVNPDGTKENSSNGK